MHLLSTPGAHCCCWLTANAPRIPYGHMRTNKSKENQQFKGHLPMTGPTQPGTVCISTLGPLPSAHKQQPPFTTAVFLSFHPPLIHATGTLKTPAPSCVYHPAQVPTQCYLRVHLSAERPAGSPSWGSPPGGLSSTGMPTATTPRGTCCSLRLAAFSQNCLGSP